LIEADIVRSDRRGGACGRWCRATDKTSPSGRNARATRPRSWSHASSSRAAFDAPQTRAVTGICPSGPVLVCDEPLGCSSSVLRTGHHFVALRRRTVMRRFEIGKDHKITHSIGRRPRKTLTCTLPSNLRSIRAAWRPRSSRLRSRRASRACRRGSRPAPSPGVARSRLSTSRCCRNPPCR